MCIRVHSGDKHTPAGTALVPGLCLVIVCLWTFPTLWYSRSEPFELSVWLQEQKAVPGWSVVEVPIERAAERRLAADSIFNAEYRRAGGTERVLAFAAHRYSEKVNDIGLFVHTPDRCWTESGWKIEPASPECIELWVEGVRMFFERRLLVYNGRRELVYFGGLLGGRPLPYRLDHNLSVGVKEGLRSKGADRSKANLRGGALRALDSRFWRRVWEAFLERRELLGSKQYIRISTEVGAEQAIADARLAGFLAQWLRRVDYQTELNAWRSKGRREQTW